MDNIDVIYWDKNWKFWKWRIFDKEACEFIDCEFEFLKIKIMDKYWVIGVFKDCDDDAVMMMNLFM